MVSDQGETSGVAAVVAGSRLIAEDRAVSKRWMTVPTRGAVFNHSERGEMVDLEYEEREWVCVFCKEPQRYVLINGYCEIGCGGAHHFYNGRRADYCSKPECRSAGERFLNGANNELSRRPTGGGETNEYHEN